MNSTTTRTNRAKKSSAYLNVMVGLFTGVAIGVIGFLVVVWLFNVDHTGFNRAASDDSKHSSIETTKTEFDWIFNEEVAQSDLLQVFETLNTLNQHQLRDLTAKSSTQPWTPRLYTVQEMLVELLAQSSPLEAVASLDQFPDHRKHALLHLVFTYWSSSNLEEAISAAAHLPRSDKSVAMRAIFEERSDLSSQDFSMVANEFDIDSELEAWEQEIAIYGLMDQDPAMAFDILLNDEIEDGQQRGLYQQVVEKWFEYEGMKLLTKLEDAPFIRGISTDLFDQVAGQDRRAALEFAVTVDESKHLGLGYEIMDSWSRYDAKEALQAVLDLPKSPFRNSMLRSVVSNWGEESPNLVLDGLLEIPRLYRSSAVSAAANQFALEDPETALERIEMFRLVPGSYVDRAIQTILRSWSDDAPELAVDWIQANMEEGTSDRIEALSSVSYQLALIDPDRAMSIAVEEIKPEGSWYSLETIVINALLGADTIDTAIELLDQIQDDSTLLRNASRVGGELVEANRIDDCLSLADSLVEEQRLQYFYRVTSGLLDTRSSDALDLIERLPTAELQSGVVEQIMNGWSVERYLNAEQIDTLRSYVSE